MSNVNITPNMNLPAPIPGVDPGIDYANNQNSCLTIIDQHNHSAGFGVQITPNGINVNTDLPFNVNNATNLRSAQFFSESAVLSLAGDVGCVYVVGNELYYNDVTGGHQVQITTNGSVNAGAGSISGLPSGTASASFSAGTFTWQSATAVAANMDAQSYILRNSTASSKGLTLQAPAAMAANYSLTLPTVPSSNPAFMTMDTSGNMGTSISMVGGIVASNIANQTITATQIANSTITGTQIANASIPVTKLQAGTFTKGSVITTTTTTNTTAVSVSGLTVSPTSTGLVMVIQVVGTATNTTYSGTAGSIVPSTSCNVLVLRDGTTEIVTIFCSGGLPFNPATLVWYDTTVTAGSHTYQVQTMTNGSGTVGFNSVQLCAYELV